MRIFISLPRYKDVNGSLSDIIIMSDGAVVPNDVILSFSFTPWYHNPLSPLL